MELTTSGILLISLLSLCSTLCLGISLVLSAALAIDKGSGAVLGMVTESMVICTAASVCPV